jgi:hypothetical protein
MAAGVALALAAGLLAAFALSGGTATPAYAVVLNSDGSVTLTLNQLLGARAADERLASLGVKVTVLTREQGCTSTGIRAPDAISPLSSGALGRERRSVESILLGQGALIERSTLPRAHTGFRGLTLRIDPTMIPPEDTLVITARLLDGPSGDGHSHAIGMSAGLYRDPAPTCLTLG